MGGFDTPTSDYIYVDENLRNMLPATNDAGCAVLNRNFDGWRSYIESNLILRSALGGRRYEKKPEKTLYKLCRKHARKHGRDTKATTTIMLTHPFYLQLSHMYMVDKHEGKRKEADAYLDSLMGFLEDTHSRPDTNIVACETVHHYAAATSLLLEKGLIDRVIFTQYDNGTPVKMGDLNRYRRHDIFFGGGYNKRCLTHTVDAMQLAASPGLYEELRDFILNNETHEPLSMWGIRELSIGSPADGKSLRVECINGLHPDSMITLDELYSHLDQKDQWIYGKPGQL